MSEPATANDVRRNEVRQAFSDALSSALAPLISESPSFNVSLAELREIVSEIWFQSAADTLRKQDLPVTAARLALLANISRSEAQRWVSVQEQRGWVRRKRVTALAIAQVLSKWHTDPNFSGVYGLPLELSLIAPVDEKGFANLVAEVDEELDPDDVLTSLTGAELIDYIGDKWVRCVKRENVPDATDLGRISLIGEVLGHHVKAALSNIELSADKKDSLFEKEFVCDFALDTPQRQEVERSVRKHGSALLGTLDNNAKAFLPTARLQDAKFCGVGIYYFEIERPRSRSETLAMRARKLRAKQKPTSSH